MAFQISYEDGWAVTDGAREQGATRTEYFGTEHDALHRARELVESGVHHGVTVRDGAGASLAGVLLQLKLGVSAAD